MLRLKFKYIFFAFLLPLFLYLGLYTWNWRTGALDDLAAFTGMEFAGWVLAPGKWVSSHAHDLWDRYFFFVQTEAENTLLRKQVHELKLEVIRLREQAAEQQLLASLLQVTPLDGWDSFGARVIAHQIGPNAVLQTFFVNKGRVDGVKKDQPVITPDGVVGRILKTAPHYATVLVLTDPNSYIPVLGQKSRTQGITRGQGQGEALQVNHVPKNGLLFSGELLITSGLADIYPKGLPVARITDIEITELSLFKKVVSGPLVRPFQLEGVLILKRNERSEPVPLKRE